MEYQAKDAQNVKKTHVYLHMCACNHECKNTGD